MATPGGRRERHKRETRAALQDAANRLFAERGYDRTTVRDIAEAAGVTERTFFRYFSVKEELALDAATGWLEPLGELIRGRPRDEDTVTALHRVVLDTMAAMRASSGPTLLSLYANRQPIEFLRTNSPRGMQLRLAAIEVVLAPAIRDRLVIDGWPDTTRLDYRAATLARVCVTLVRSALIEDLRLRRESAPDRPDLGELLDVAFDGLARAWRPDPPVPPATT